MRKKLPTLQQLKTRFPMLTDDFLEHHLDMVQKARQSRILEGDPIDNLVKFMQSVVTDEEGWRQILDER